jgi:hypothetical protein
MASACNSPRVMNSLARSKSDEVSPSREGAISTSCAVSVARLWRTFCSVRMLIICAVTPVRVDKVSRLASGVPMLTTIRRCAPIWRATSTGVLLTRPPSPRMRPLTSIGANTPGTDMLERKAAARSPSRKVTGWPVSMSVATARNGVGNWSKLLTWRVDKVRRRKCDSSPRLDTEPSGALMPSAPMPTSSSGETSKSCSLRRCDNSRRSTRLANTLSQSSLRTSASTSLADRPLAYSPPTMAPIEVPAITSTGMRSRSSTLSTPTCARPRAPPPDRTRPMRGRASALPSGSAAEAGGDSACAQTAEAAPKPRHTAHNAAGPPRRKRWSIMASVYAAAPDLMQDKLAAYGRHGAPGRASPHHSSLTWISTLEATEASDSSM